MGPNNGALSAALPQEQRTQAGAAGSPVPLPPGFAAYAPENEELRRQPVSGTFHGRDIFAPAAAHLSLSVAPERFGGQVREIVALPPFTARAQLDGSLVGRVLHIDHFGNVVTTIHAAQIAFDQPVFELCGRRISGLARTYAGGRGLIALPGRRGEVRRMSWARRLEARLRSGRLRARR